MTTTRTAATRRMRSQLLDAVQQQAERITQDAADRIGRTLPGDVPPDRIAHGVAPIVDDTLMLLREETAMATPLPLLPEMAADCLGAGLPVDALLGSLGQLASVLVEHLDWATSQLPPSPAAATAAAATVRDLASIATSSRLSLEERCRRPAGTTLEPASDDADPGPPYTLLVAVPFRTERDPVPALRELLEACLPVVARASSPSAAHVAVVVPGPTDARLLRRLAHEGDALLLLHPPAPGMPELNRLYGDSTTSLAGIVRLAGSPAVVAPDQVAAVLALQSAPLRCRVDFVRVTLGPVLAMRPSRAVLLLDVLRELARGTGLSRLPRALGLHRKGVDDRCARLRERTGLDLRRPDERLRLLLAFALWKLNQPAMHPLGSPDWCPSGAVGLEPSWP